MNKISYKRIAILGSNIVNHFRNTWELLPAIAKHDLTTNLNGSFIYSTVSNATSSSDKSIKDTVITTGYNAALVAGIFTTMSIVVSQWAAKAGHAALLNDTHYVEFNTIERFRGVGIGTVYNALVSLVHSHIILLPLYGSKIVESGDYNIRLAQMFTILLIINFTNALRISNNFNKQDYRDILKISIPQSKTNPQHSNSTQV